MFRAAKMRNVKNMVIVIVIVVCFLFRQHFSYRCISWGL